MSDAPRVNWQEREARPAARWHSEAGLPPPKRILLADDQMPADQAYRLASQGTALLWRGDYHNARQLLQALARRIDRKKPGKPPANLTEAFHRNRQTLAQRAAILGKILIPVDAGGTIPLRRAPLVADACREAGALQGDDFVVALKELQGWVGAHEWRKKGIFIAALGAKLHPHYGVFSPLRGEYVDLVANTPLPATDLAFDIGTGSGVLAAVLAKRGIRRIVATDQDPRAIACARGNLERLGVSHQVEVIQADLFPPGEAALVVCNPPWVPAKPSSPIEYAVFDPDSRMLKGYLAGLAEHLTALGEGWLILSDLAEHLGLRSREQLLQWIAEAGLQVLNRHDTRPRHGKASDASDPLHAARAREVTSLWRLGKATTTANHSAP